MTSCRGDFQKIAEGHILAGGETGRGIIEEGVCRGSLAEASVGLSSRRLKIRDGQNTPGGKKETGLKNGGARKQPCTTSG